VDWVRVGLSLRALRRRRGWTQARLGLEAHCSRSLIALVERGHGDRLGGHTLVRIAEALSARVRIQILWHGEDLDRLVDRRHAAIVERVVRRLHALGWHVLPEVTFQFGAERGSIDVLATHASTRAMLIIEVKSVVPDVQATLSGLDRKSRLAWRIAAERNVRPTSVSRLLVLPEGTTTRRRIQHVEATFNAAYPARNIQVNRWLQAPTGSLSGILFLPNVNQGDVRRRSTLEGDLPVHARSPETSQMSTTGRIRAKQGVKCHGGWNSEGSPDGRGTRRPEAAAAPTETARGGAAGH